MTRFQVTALTISTLASVAIVPLSKAFRSGNQIPPIESGTQQRVNLSNAGNSSAVVKPISGSRKVSNGVVSTEYWSRSTRPFTVVQQVGAYSWTAEDGMKEDIMKQLSNNSLMLDELRNQNEYTLRRQVVYVDPEIEQQREAVLSGELEAITFPGFDGEVFEFTVNDVDRFDPNAEELLEGEEKGGYFGGKIGGDDSSSVQVGISGSSWSIGIFQGGQHYEITTGEPNQWIISEIDPQRLAGQNPAGCRVGEGNHVGSFIQ